MSGANTRIDENLTRARHVTKWAIIVVIALAMTWFIIAFLSGSVGLLAKGIDSLSDLIATVTVFLGLWLAQRAPSQKYPYGYFKAESMAALIVAVFIFITGLGVLWQAIQRILFPTELSFLGLALVVTLASIPIIYVMSRYLKKVGRETGSTALYNKGQEFQMDILASIAVIFGLIFAFFGLPWIESVVGFIIGIFILRSSFQLAHESVLILMDAGQDPEQIKAIEQLALPILGVLGVHAIKLRRAGPICFGEMHLEVAGKTTVLQSHLLAEEISTRVKEVYPDVLSFLVHVEPVLPTTFRVAFPVDKPEATPDSTPNMHFGSTPFFLVMDIDRRKIVLWEVMPNPFAKDSKKRGKNTAHLLIDAKVEIVFAEKMGETPLSILRNHLIHVYKQKSQANCRNNIEAFLEDELPPLKAKEITETSNRP
ncbi:MAG: cation diffusion facilitator family transporter [Promethearchaeota archaeon]